MKPYLLLFDIDGTLLKTDGMGMEAMYHVARDMFGDAFSWEGIDPSGHLDPLIFAEAATINGLDGHEDHHDAFRDQYLQRLARSLGAQPHRVDLMPGVHEVLATLRERAVGRGDVILGLLTGNYSDAVPIKLASINVDPAWFAITAFGDEGATRPDLVRLALDRYQQLTGEPAEPHRVIVIGDTPRDVRCAHAHGCRCLAVATGRFTTEQLRVAGADVVAPNLADGAALFAMLDG